MLLADWGKMSLEGVMKSRLVILNIKYRPEFGYMAETINGENFLVKPILYKNTGKRYYGREVYAIRDRKSF